MIVKGVIIAFLIVVSGYFVAFTSTFLGFEVTEVEQTQEWIENRADHTAYGGSSFEAAGNPLTGTITTLFRPFPWEAGGVLPFAASLELLVLWALIWRRRHYAAAFVRRYWRYEPVLISLVFTLVLSAAVGMAVGNFGTLVRQRVVIYPFLFILVAAYPRVRAATRLAQTRQLKRRSNRLSPRLA